MKRPLRTSLIVFGAVIAIGGILMAAWTGIILLSSHDVRTETSFRISANDLIIDTDDGGVTIEPGASGVVEVKRKITDSVNGPEPTWSLEGNRLKLRLHCPSGFGIGCSGSYTLKVPLGLPLTVQTDNGAIEVSGLKQNMTFATDNGHIEISDSVGDLKLATDNGGIDVSGVSANTVVAKTDNGGIRMRLDNAPKSVEARTDNGGIRLTLPDDGAGYDQDIQTDNGNKNIDLKHDPASPRDLVAHTDNGSITIQPAVR